MFSKSREAKSKKLKAKRTVVDQRCVTRGFYLFISCWFLMSCSTKSESSSTTSSSNGIKFQQYYIQGEQLYLKNCSNCHQENGTGLGLLFPPVSQSDFVDQNVEKVICLMRNGIKGELIVNGKSFNKEMKGIPSLTDLEVAEIATYVYNTWGRDKGIIEVQLVSRVLSQCDTILVNR